MAGEHQSASKQRSDGNRHFIPHDIFSCFSRSRAGLRWYTRDQARRDFIPRGTRRTTGLIYRPAQGADSGLAERSDNELFDHRRRNQLAFVGLESL
jgi:hypothetical protein